MAGRAKVSDKRVGLRQSVAGNRGASLNIGIVFTALVLLAAAATNVVAGDSAMAFRTVGNGGNCGGCEWISATGVITTDTPETFSKFIKSEYRKGYVPPVMLNSPGGDLIASMQLGKLIRERGVNTSVGETVKDGDWYKNSPGTCVSACVFVLMGGTERFIDKDNMIGIHQFYDKRALEDVNAIQFSTRDTIIQQAIMGVLVAYVKLMGVNTDLLFLSSMVSPTNIRYLS